MSDNIVSAGVMCPLDRKLMQEEYADIVDDLYDKGVFLNYEGTLVYTDVGGAEYGIYFGDEFTDDWLSQEQHEALKSFGLSVLSEHARPYRCLWYDGADSDMDEMTIDNFLESTGQRHG